MKLFAASIFYCCVFILASSEASSQGQGKGYHYTEIKLPQSPSLFTSFYVNDANQAFLPINGGIFIPKDSSWFLPPSGSYYFTSFAPNLNDTSLFVFANTFDSSELFYLKSSASVPIMRYSVLTLSKGLYNLKFKNNTCYIWGHDSAGSRIGILGDNEIKWLLQVRGVIRQIQIGDSSEILFAMNKGIYRLDTQERVLQLDKEIYGFCTDKKGNIIVSFGNEIGMASGNRIDIISTGVTGLLEFANNTVFILSNKLHTLYMLSNQ